MPIGQVRGCRNGHCAGDEDAHRPNSQHGLHGEPLDVRNWGHARDRPRGRYKAVTTGTGDRIC